MLPEHRRSRSHVVGVALLNLLLLLFAAVVRSGEATPAHNRCPSVVFVMHSYYKNDNLTSFSLNTFLSDVNVVVVTGHDAFNAYVGYAGDNVENFSGEKFSIAPQRRRLVRVEYNGNPGKDTHHATYKGTHRTMMGLLIANDTFPDAEWYYVLDDDNYMPVEYVCEELKNHANAKVPLLLSGAVGPKAGGHAPCNEVNSASHWSCCTSAVEACVAYLDSADGVQSFFRWNETLQTMVALPCTSPDASRFLSGLACRQAVPWPEGMMYGFPYRLRNQERKIVDKQPHHAMFRPHSFQLYPYGGATYALSKPLMNIVGRDAFEFAANAIQWNNADIDVMTIVLNAGYSITSLTSLAVAHHVKEIPQFISVGMHQYEQSDEIKRLLCFYDTTGIETKMCKRVCPACPQFVSSGGGTPSARMKGLARTGSLRGST